MNPKPDVQAAAAIFDVDLLAHTVNGIWSVVVYSATKRDSEMFEHYILTTLRGHRARD